MIRGYIPFHKFYYKSVSYGKQFKYLFRTVMIKSVENENLESDMINFLVQQTSIPQIKIQRFLLKNPDIHNIDKSTISSIINTLNKCSIDLEESLDNPQLYRTREITLEKRNKVLLECGFINISAATLTNYLTLVRRKSVADLKKLGYIPEDCDIQERLTDCLSTWPISPGMMKRASIDETLNTIRMKILARYLELLIDISPNEFHISIERYQRIRHTPLAYLDKVVNILQLRLHMSAKKIRSNFGVLQANPDNIECILSEVKTLGGIDVRDIIQRRPILLNVNYKSLQKIQHFLNDKKISLEAQRRCFEIYTLGYESIKERFEEVQRTPEFNALLDNPRILRIVFYKNKACLRLNTLKAFNKNKSVSLHILSGTAVHYESYLQSPTFPGRGVDISQGVWNLFKRVYSYSQIKQVLGKHTFMIKVPVLNTQQVYNRLINDFSCEEIFWNCPILLYPLDAIEPYLTKLIWYQKLLLKNELICPIFLKSSLGSSMTGVKSLSNLQLLSLTLYFIEKEYHFTGEGVWSTEKNQYKE